MSNNPTAIRHYKLLLDSTKFQLANIPSDDATVAVMEAWGCEFVQTWVSRPSLVPFCTNSPCLPPQSKFERDPHYVVLVEMSVWRTTASVQLDAYLLVPWLLWGESFLPNTAERRRREQQAAKRRVVDKKWRQEAEAEKARQAAQSAELKKTSQVSLRPSDREDDTRMIEAFQASVKRKRAPTITARMTFSGVSAFIHFRAF